MHVCQAKIAAGAAEGALFVVEAKEPKHGGVEIVDMDLVFSGLEAELVGCPVDIAAAHATACHPGSKPVMVVVAAIDLAGVGAWGWQFNRRGAAKFASPDDQR